MSEPGWDSRQLREQLREAEQRVRALEPTAVAVTDPEAFERSRELGRRRARYRALTQALTHEESHDDG